MRLNNFVNEGSENDIYNIVAEVYSHSLPYIMEFIREFHHITLATPILLSGRNSSDIIINNPIRTNRRPKDTDYRTHLFIDSVFEKLFGINVRSSSIFATGKFNTADSYGNRVYGIFPTGNNYEIVWSDSINDLYTDKIEDSEYHFLGYSFEDIVDDMLENGNYYDDAEQELKDNFDENHSRDDYETEDDYYSAGNDYINDHYRELARSNAERDAEDRVSEDEGSFIKMVKSHYQKGHLKNAIMSHNEIMLSGTSYIGVRYDYLPYILRYMEVYGTKKPTPHMFASAMVGINLDKFPRSGYGSGHSIQQKRINTILSGIDMSNLKQ